MSHVLLDTGPLVALLSRREQHHSWATMHFARFTEPCLTCEPVVTEAYHLLAKVRGGPTALRATLQQGLIVLDFDLRSELSEVLDLMTCYENLPMSVADACLVRMAEITPGALVFTLDEDFRIYRKNKAGLIDLIAPFA